MWASLEKTPREVITAAFVEAQRRDPLHERRWVALVDGSDQQLRTLRNVARRLEAEITIVLDFIHVSEYVWKASMAFFTEKEAGRDDWVEERLLRILRGESSQVAAGMRRSATLRKVPRKRRKAVDACAKYLLGHTRYLRYDRYLEQGLPIATGVIEGACRHLIGDRMDITGARWSLSGAEAVLRLRALRSSGDFEAYWRFHEQAEYQRNHASRYQGGKVVPIRGRHITRVK